MSQSDRDWYRDGGAGRRASAWAGTRLTWTLMGVLLAAWLVTSGSSEHAGPGGAGRRLLAWASLSADGVLSHGRAWQPLTWGWLHEPRALRPILWSLLLLFFFGREAERDLGRLGALATFAAGVLVAGLAALPWLSLVAGDAPIADASGGTFALAAACARRRPGERRDPGLPVRGTVALVLAVRTADLLWLGGGAAYAPVVVGAAAGWVAGGLRPTTRERGARARLGAREGAADAPAAPAGDAARARLDGLLAKIHEAGIDALTEDERAFLEGASRRYRDPPAGSR